MKLKDKIKSYSFWVSLASAVILILKVLGNRFGFTVDEGMVSDLFTALCSILVLLGIIVVPTVTSTPALNNKPVFQDTQNTLQKEESKDPQTITKVNEEQIAVVDKKNSTLENSHSDDIIEMQDASIKIEQDVIVTEEVSKEDHSINNVAMPDEEPVDSQNITVEAEEEKSDNKAFDNTPDIHETITIADLHSLKELFNKERAKFTQNMNEYIFELQEEIRKAREQM